MKNFFGGGAMARKWAEAPKKKRRKEECLITLMSQKPTNAAVARTAF
jgi:hypothetical protein